MSDVDTTDEVAIQGEEEQKVTDRVAEAVAEVNPPGSAIYPENDAVRGAMSGMPAGNTDELPPGADSVREAMKASLTPEEVEEGDAQGVEFPPEVSRQASSKRIGKGSGGTDDVG
jgi:hypothetical protein